MNLRHVFGKALADLNMFPKRGERVLVACSGGADSLALLYLLYAWRERFAYDLGVITVDHQLREESGIEAQLVRQTAWTLGLPCWVKQVNAGTARPRGVSLEMACSC